MSMYSNRLQQDNRNGIWLVQARCPSCCPTSSVKAKKLICNVLIINLTTSPVNH